MTCTSCAGKGCKECEQTGSLLIENCPMRMIPHGVWDVIGLAELFRKGLPPIAGGVLDQAASFVSAARFVWGEIDYWKAKLDPLNEQT